MHFWRQEYFQTLKDLSAEAIRFPEWSDYASFCTKYEDGLRKEAFVILDKFISEFGRRPFSERRLFVRWLLTQVEGRQGRHMLVPYPLQTRLIKPTLLEWTLVEPDCSEPHRWLGKRENLVEAIRLDPNDELARRKLIVWIISRVSMNGHELPRGYLGDVNKDLEELAEAEKLIEFLKSRESRDRFEAQIKRDRDAINDHIQKSRISTT